MKGFSGFDELGRDLRPHQAQREGPHGPGVPRRRRRARSRGRGCARTARAASSTPPGATTSAPGATPASTTCVERGIRWACGAGPGDVAGAYVDRPEMTTIAQGRQAVRVRDGEGAVLPAGKKWGTTGEPITKMQKPLAARGVDEALSCTPADFEVKLFAAEPQLGGKPICMNWDERGRLWVADTVDYPNELQPRGRGPRPHRHLRRHRRRRRGRQVHRRSPTS